MTANCAVTIIAENKTGILRDIGAVCAEIDANILTTKHEISTEGKDAGFAVVSIEAEYSGNPELLLSRLREIEGIISAENHSSAAEIFGKRVIVIGGGAQVAQVALGAVNEADRHNIRGERISVDTIPLVGEETIARAVEAVPRLPRAAILVLAGSLMGGKITDAIRYVQSRGIPVVCLKMVGSASSAADLVVTDPIQAGVMAVMHISTIGVFDISRVRGKEF
ncbi:MAG: DUF5612 domain-containing protein [Methanocorpusculum sp.]|nr:DUF5612 domain-containing protein [Methanocorpusculum sp.]MBQ4135405.1 DUF5612 domain-containing protein [Methanocorpusculum sp.]MBR4118379.1 DUF5612 domain-containing protein [Methanocorpusculum sp.]HJJ63992.1 DUF5612 domain-containing protein [Methanocorpusculum sp.]HJJ66833.1 DUF5612 domain-containing protein [Methanocorpusculum sp.]